MNVNWATVSGAVAIGLMVLLLAANAGSAEDYSNTDTDRQRDSLQFIGFYDDPGFDLSQPLPAGEQVDPPIALSAVLNASGSIDLTWTVPPDSDATGYKIVRRVAEGTFVTVVADTGSAETAYTDASAIPTAGVSYVYQVIALDQFEESVASNLVAVHLPGPYAPAEFAATYSGDEVVLTWEQPGVFRPTGYRIYRRDQIESRIGRLTYYEHPTGFRTYRRAQGETSFGLVANSVRPEVRSWHDGEIEPGIRYVYRIVPMIGDEEQSDWSTDSNGARGTPRQFAKVPPCTPPLGSDHDPCELRSEFGFRGGAHASSILPDEPPTYEDIMFNSYGLFPNDEASNDLLISATHLVVRGNFAVGTTNCEGYPFLLPPWVFEEEESPYADIPEGVTVQGLWNLNHWSCFTSFDVSEYLVGTGPSSITVMHPNFAIPYEATDDSSLEEYARELNAYKDWLAEAYEGSEWALWLSPSPIISVLSWAAFHYWDVQRDADAMIRVVSPDYEDHKRAGATGTRLDRHNAHLDDFRRDIVTSHESRATMTSGRIGVATTTPDLVTAIEVLPGHFEKIGAGEASFASPVLPPARPLAPSELAAGTPSQTGIELSWGAPVLSRVSGYKIVRRVPKGEFVTVVADTGSTDTTYADTSAPMTAGATYIYRVIALNEYGESVASTPTKVSVP